MKIDLDLFLSNCIKIHNNKYDYSLVDINLYKVKIICPIHGQFKQIKYHHISGHGCPKCGNCHIPTINEFIQKSNQIHNFKYDYNKVVYKNNNTNIIIDCPTHGEFTQTPGNHILRENGCPSCSGNKKHTLDKFIQKSNEIHNNKYDYSLSEYINSTTKLIIICPIHGQFNQTPLSHMTNRHGCKRCADSYIPNEKTDDYIIYRKLVRRYTERNKKQLYENWDGFDYYDNEYIKENVSLNHVDRSYPSIDHKISVYNGFLNDINPKELSDISNLCITKRSINSSKGSKNEDEFIS